MRRKQAEWVALLLVLALIVVGGWYMMTHNGAGGSLTPAGSNGSLPAGGGR